MFQIEKNRYTAWKNSYFIYKNEVSSVRIKRLVWYEILTATLCVIQREMQTKWKEMLRKQRKSHKNNFSKLLFMIK